MYVHACIFSKKACGDWLDCFLQICTYIGLCGTVRCMSQCKIRLTLLQSQVSPGCICPINSVNSDTIKICELIWFIKNVKLKILEMLDRFHCYLKIKGITPSLVRICCPFFPPSLFTVLEQIKYLAWKNKKGWERVPFWPFTQRLVWLNLHRPKKWRRGSEQESFLSLGRAAVGLHFLSSPLFTQRVYKNYCSSPSITAYSHHKLKGTEDWGGTGIMKQSETSIHSVPAGSSSTSEDKEKSRKICWKKFVTLLVLSYYGGKYCQRVLSPRSSITVIVKNKVVLLSVRLPMAQYNAVCNENLKDKIDLP